MTLDAQSAGNRFIVYTNSFERHSVALDRSIPPASTIREHHWLARSRYYYEGRDEYFDGDIASLHYWNRALS